MRNGGGARDCPVQFITPCGRALPLRARTAGRTDGAQLDHTPDTSRPVSSGLRRRAPPGTTRASAARVDTQSVEARAIMDTAAAAPPAAVASRQHHRGAQSAFGAVLQPDVPAVAADDGPGDGKAQTRAVARTPWAPAFSSRLREARRNATGRHANSTRPESGTASSWPRSGRSAATLSINASRSTVRVPSCRMSSRMNAWASVVCATQVV